jgi:transcriptional regulator with XRE-family HTH domain
MTRHDPETDPKGFLGDELRRARVAAGFSSQETLAARLGFDRTVVAKAETGDRPPTDEVLTAWCEACHLDMDLFRRLGVLARRADGSIPTWFVPWPDAEAQARALRSYEPLLVPGLLQTEDYARAVLRGAQADASDDQIEEQVAARLQRQDILAGAKPPRLWVVIDEGVLHRTIGGSKTMLDQTWHLARMSDRPKVSVQVIPFEAGERTGLLGAFTIADRDGAGSILYLDTATTGQVVEAPSIVGDAGLIFDTLRSEALPRGASRALIMKVAEERWTT